MELWCWGPGCQACGAALPGGGGKTEIDQDKPGQGGLSSLGDWCPTVGGIEVEAWEAKTLKSWVEVRDKKRPAQL